MRWRVRAGPIAGPETAYPSNMGLKSGHEGGERALWETAPESLFLLRLPGRM